MTEEFEFDGLSWIFQYDSYQSEAESFEYDVHMLILDTLRAATVRLNEEASKDDSQIMAYAEKARGAAAERLAEEQADLWIGVIQKERFLRNQALVALMSRLTHALLKMASSAEYWAPRGARDFGRDDEFKKIWREFKERFDLVFSPKYIGFIEPFRRARNRIVHSGGEANPYRPFDEIDYEAELDGYLDLSFSKKYPAFVNGESYGAEISITDQLLDKAVAHSCRLVRHAAQQLRILELEFAKKERTERFRAESPEGEMPI